MLLNQQFLVNIARIWFCFKKITGDNVLKWGCVYFKSPPGSEREKLSFKRFVELWAVGDPQILNIYPDYSPPDTLRKIAVGRICDYSKAFGAVIFFESQDLLRSGKLSQYSKIEIDNCKENIRLWANLLVSKPNDEEEKAALQKLKEARQIPPKAVFYRNYLVTIE